MKTWLSNYNLPQFIAVLGLLFYAIPGLIFIAWGWGKYKCPNCEALAKNTLAPELIASDLSPSRAERTCHYCAETILAAAKVCKHCNREVV